MRLAGVEPDSTNYNAAISACENEADMSTFSALLSSMRWEGLAPDDILFSAAVRAFGATISACENASAWFHVVEDVDLWSSASACEKAITRTKVEQGTTTACEDAVLPQILEAIESSSRKITEFQESASERIALLEDTLCTQADFIDKLWTRILQQQQQLADLEELARARDLQSGLTH